MLKLVPLFAVLHSKGGIGDCARFSQLAHLCGIILTVSTTCAADIQIESFAVNASTVYTKKLSLLKIAEFFCHMQLS